jgi:4-hydroxybenzoate polyprenyltransferase
MFANEMTQKNKTGLQSLDFWKAYWMTMRPYLLFISGAAGMAGLASGPERSLSVILLTFPVFFFAYGFGQALTDCFHIDTDSISSPYRPLVQGIISRTQVLAVSLIGLVLGSAVLLLFNPWAFLFGMLAVFGVSTYTYFKRRWWGGPLYDAWIVAVLPLIGALVASGPGFDLTRLFQNGILLPIMLSVFFSYANFVLMGYFKDISADKQSGYKTFVVVFGWEKAALVSDVLAVLSVLASGWGLIFWLLTTESVPFRWIAIPVFLAAAVILAAAQIGIHRTRDEKKAFTPIAHVVRGFILLLMAETCLLEPSWIPAVLIFYTGFEWILRKRPAREQV